MSMHDARRSDRHSKNRWVIPGVAVAGGIAYLVAGWVGGDLEFGVFGLLLMSAVAVALLVVSRRSETVAGLLDRRDERINDLDLRATTFAGASVLVTVIVLFIAEIARGEDGSPYYQLAALGGAAYVVALVVLRYRS